MLEFTFFRELWVFPLFTQFGAWFGFTLLFLLGSGVGPRRAAFRAVVSLVTVVYFAVSSGLPPLGFSVVLLPPALWAATHVWGARGLILFLPLLLSCLVWGHYPLHVGPELAAELGQNGRLSIHVLSLFFFFRIISFGVATGFRREKVSCLESIEYFFAPPFLLEPGKGFMTTYATFREPVKSKGERWRGLQWCAQGVFFQLLFALTAERFFYYLNSFYYEGISPWRLNWLVSVGLGSFFLTYIEKARMSYTLAGLLRLSGRAIEPDFRAPWMAKSLLEYWRRFHYWVLEFYVEALYQPLSYYLSRWFSARTTVALGMLTTFLIGTALSHMLYYSASLSVALALGSLFGISTALHYLGGTVLQPLAKQWGWLGMPITWATVAVLYAIAYPAYGLGWSLRDMLAFFG